MSFYKKVLQRDCYKYSFFCLQKGGVYPSLSLGVPQFQLGEYYYPRTSLCPPPSKWDRRPGKEPGTGVPSPVDRQTDACYLLVVLRKRAVNICYYYLLEIDLDAAVAVWSWSTEVDVAEAEASTSDSDERDRHSLRRSLNVGRTSVVTYLCNRFQTAVSTYPSSIQSFSSFIRSLTVRLGLRLAQVCNTCENDVASLTQLLASAKWRHNNILV